jgi:hypothetical protein
MNIDIETEKTIYAMMGLLLVVAMFAFVIYTSYDIPETVYGGSVGENMSKYSCLENPDLCTINVSDLSHDFRGVE